MGHQSCKKASERVGENSFRRQFAIAQRVEHGGVGAQESAPAHADGREDGDGIAVDPPVFDETGHQSEGSADGSEGRDGEGYLMGVG